MCIGSLQFTSETEKLVVVPVTNVVNIIMQLARDPLQKPETPVFTEEALNSKAKNNIKTVELQKTVYRIGKLLQMSYGQLGALIINENVSSGDGSLEIMIPGHKLNVIFCVVKLKHYIQISEILEEENIQFFNHIMIILHSCAEKWEGWANKSEGQRYVLTWKLPVIDDSDNEKNE